MSQAQLLHHPRLSRRTVLQAGAVGLLGLGMNHLRALRAAAPAGAPGQSGGRARSCIYIFLSGGLAPENVAGAIDRVQPYAVDACSRLELSPGWKDPSRVTAFVRAARSR